MKQKLLNNISEYITWDNYEQQYHLNDGVELNPTNIYLKRLSESLVESRSKIKTTNDVLLQEYKYADNIKPVIVENAINRLNCIKMQIFHSIKNKKGQKIVFIEGECTNKDHLAATKRFITEINNFCYKYDISKIICDQTLLYLTEQAEFIGHLDLVLFNKQHIYQIELKTSRVNYLEKYCAQVFLNRLLLEDTNQIKVSESFILNIFEQRTILKCDSLDKKTEHKIRSLLRTS
ncbi:hypothetical protein SCLARK_00299 [Spiroplasma clarkii]|uniref:Uncharacterized protein n=1 Tax=Spiroplasma clarkii TaxID=2139 RepID=A0A1Y0KZ91_9MOLU|nr:hypothetical protein [Spiroplasma clarkii]ARU91056.1 hypothetical protein SCLARK_00299 [Spiroplasma clarkii]ATX70492.1 hypothetical protein SCLAR_v1c01610 [Spiroplasma clarkii]